MSIFDEEEVRAATLDYFDGDELAANVWMTKYALKNKEGQFVERTPSDMHRRLASEFARIEKKFGGDRQLSEDEIFNLLDKFKYIVPQGSPMYGVGNPYQAVSLSNCVVIDSPADDISSIINRGRDLANLSKRRAGVGIDLSELRPEGMRVNNAAQTTSGAWSFADLYSSIGRQIGQGGRRAALMLSLGVEHPDAAKFAVMKADLTKVTGANVSLKIPDKFMEALRDGEPFRQQWPLGVDNPEFTQDIDTEALWKVIIEQATNNAEPGLLFWDNICRELPANEYEAFKSVSTNPCCFSEKEQVEVLTRGGTKDLKDITPEDEVYVPLEGDYFKTSGYFEVGQHEVFRVKFDNGKHLVITGNHKLYHWEAGKLAELKDIPVGDSVMTIGKSGQPAEILSIKSQGVHTVGCIEVPEYHNFSANGFVSGNSEIPLSANDACRLISINLSHFVNNAFDEDAYFDVDLFKGVTAKAMRLIDDLAELELEALGRVIEEHCDTDDERVLWGKLREACEQGRRTGLGAHGLADCLAKLRLRYDSEEAIEKVREIFSEFRNAAYTESVDMAEERGAFPAWDWETEKGNAFLNRLPPDLIERMSKVGRRNISLLTCAPTGSVSICSQTSSGIEPVFRNGYTRRRKLDQASPDSEVHFVDELGDRWSEFQVYHHNVETYLKKTGQPQGSELPDYFVTSEEIDWQRRIDIQAAIGENIDHALSSCLAGGSHMVHTSAGLMYIEDLASSANKGFCQPTADVTTTNHEGEEVQIDEAYVNGVSQTLKVTFVGKEEVTATPNHKLRVLGAGYIEEWKRMDELEEGDLVIGRKGMQCFGSCQKTIQTIMGEFKATCRAGKGNHKPIDIPKTMSKALARLLGYMISDGSISDNGIILSQLNNNVAADFESLVETVFGIESGKRQEDSRCEGLLSIPVNSRSLRDYMEYLGVTRSAHTKSVPKVIFQGAGRGQTAEFLKGLTLDGYVSKDKICAMTTVSKKLANEIVALLNQFGIEAIIGVNPANTREFPGGNVCDCAESYDVLCCGENAARFIEYIGFAEDRKTEEAKTKFKRPSRKGLGGIVPNYNLRETFRRDILPEIKSSRLYDMLHSMTSSFKNEMGISRDNLLFFHDLGLEVPKILLDPTYRFMEVRSIEDGGAVPTYDLHIKEGNSYVVNGLVSHNTINLPKGTPTEVVSDLYRRAWEKGLKGVTVYVDGSRSGVLLSNEETSANKDFLTLLREEGCIDKEVQVTSENVIVEGVSLPDSYLNGPTKIVKREGNKYYFNLSYLPKDKDHKFPIALWINCNRYEDDEYVSLNRAFKALSELLISKGVSPELVQDTFQKIVETSRRGGTPDYGERVGKGVAMALRHNIQLIDIVQALTGIEGDYISSTLTAVRKFLKEQIADGTKVEGVVCDSCQSTNVIMEGGCDRCLDCGGGSCN